MNAARGPATLAAVVLASAVGACGSKDSGDAKTTRTSAAAKVRKPGARTTTQTVPLADVAPQQVGREGTPGVTGSDAASGDTTGVFRPFAANSPWNATVDTSSVDPGSTRLIARAQLRLGATESGGSNAVITPGTDGAGADDGTGALDSTRSASTDRVRTTRRRIDAPLYINTRRWTTPVVDSEGGEPTSIVCRQLNLLPPNNNCGDGAFVDQLNIPTGQDPLPQYDGWYTVLDRQAGVAYDLWRARRAREGNAISYQYLRRWDLNSTGFLPPDEPSGRGSGLPLFAGLILPEEIQKGRIDHALAISVPGPAQRRYVQPGSTTDGNGVADALPEGARIRLKRSVSTADVLRRTPSVFFGQRRRRAFPDRTNRRAAEAVISALRRYGAIVVDRARVPTLYAKLNFNWQAPLRSQDGLLLDPSGRRPLRRKLRRLPNQGTPLLRGSELQGLRLSDFEVVKLGPLLRYPSLGDIQVAPLPGGALAQEVQTTPTTTTPAAGRTRTVAPTFRPGAATTSTTGTTGTTGTTSATTPTTSTAP